MFSGDNYINKNNIVGTFVEILRSNLNSNNNFLIEHLSEILKYSQMLLVRELQLVILKMKKTKSIIHSGLLLVRAQLIAR